MSKYEINLGHKVYNVIVNKFTAESAELEINGHPYELQFKGPIKTIMDGVTGTSKAFTPPFPASAQPVQPAQSVSAPAPSLPKSTDSEKITEGQTVIVAPIPGSIIEILVKVGDQIEEGQMVIKMEAMKMENEITTSSAGTVKSININVGDAVSQGDTLIIVE